MASMVRRGYFLRMYFWIDSVATLSMALDINALMNAMTHSISQARPGLCMKPCKPCGAGGPSLQPLDKHTKPCKSTWHAACDCVRNF